MLTPEERWEQGIPHCDKSEDIGGFLQQHSDLQFGGDGDDGEAILYMLDMYFERERERGGNE